MEQEQALGQLSVFQSFSLQHVSSNSLVIALSEEFLDALTLILLAGSIEFIIEGKLLDIVKILLLKISSRYIIIGINKGEHILKHTTGGT